MIHPVQRWALEFGSKCTQNSRCLKIRERNFRRLEYHIIRKQGVKYIIARIKRNNIFEIQLVRWSSKCGWEGGGAEAENEKLFIMISQKRETAHTYKNIGAEVKFENYFQRRTRIMKLFFDSSMSIKCTQKNETSYAEPAWTAIYDILNFNQNRSKMSNDQNW